MATPHVGIRVPVDLDKCDAATLHGIVRRALEQSSELTSFAEFRGIEEVALTSVGDDLEPAHESAFPVGPTTFVPKTLRPKAGA
jgi:hypothetical protein